MLIKNLETLKIFLKQNVKTSIFGVGVYAFDRLGLEDVLKSYRLLSLRYSRDTELTEKDVQLLALEKGMGAKHIVEPRNSTTVIRHEKTKKYLEEFPNSALIPYKSSTKMERICHKNGWILAASPVKFGKKLLEDKVKFRKILEGINVPAPPGEVILAKTLEFEALQKKYGLPFVIQHPRRGGGKGTFFVHSREHWNLAIHKLGVEEKEGQEIKEDLSNLQVIAAKYIKGPTPSITGCVTRHGVLATSPQYQIIDIPELFNPNKGSGLFCGHDWSSSQFDEEVLKQAYSAVERVGKYFNRLGYKGIFGIDFVMDEKTKKLYVTECNPRLLGSFPVITMLQILNNEPPILAFHLLEYLGIDYDMDVDEVNREMRRPKFGAQMFLHNLTGKWTRSHGDVKAGVYKIKRKMKNEKLKVNELAFIRPGYAMKHLRNEDEFLLTDGVLQKGAHYSPNRRLCRILTLCGVLSEDKKSLTPWAKDIATTVYSSFNLKPVRFAKLIKLFNPDYLAKG